MTQCSEEFARSHYCGEINETLEGMPVTLMGWVQRTRNLGGLIFVWLRDRTGIVQIVFDEKKCDADCFLIGEALRGEYVVAVSGNVSLREADAINEKLPTGKVEIFVSTAKLLNSATTPPIYIDDDHPDESEAVRLKYRYLDLRRPSLQKTLMTRHRVNHIIRSHMDAQGFIELETPILTKSTPEGARDYLVPSRVHQGQFYALPQSPQIYKQLLMLAGFDKYYQIARCFRDEDSRADRQPEFTQVDFEMSFVGQDDVLKVVEGVFSDIFKKVMDIDIKTPLERVTWRDAMDTYGSDKPDRRFGLKIVDMSAWAPESGFKVFADATQNGGTVRAINAEGCGHMSRKEIDALSDYVKSLGAKGLAWATVSEDGIKSSFAKFLTEASQAAMLDTLHAKPGDALFFIADKKSTALSVLGQLRLTLAKKQNLIDQNKYDIFCVTEFPLLEWDDEDNRFYAMHHPFTSPMDEDLQYLDSDPGRARAKAYDIVINGVEMGSGSIRIHDSEMQRKMFGLLGFTDEEARKRFGFMLDAFTYGTPPHGGFAFGIDRLMMILTSAQSLRDVIAFPKLQNASDLMMDTPSPAQKEQLELLSIEVKTPDEKSDNEVKKTDKKTDAEGKKPESGGKEE